MGLSNGNDYAMTSNIVNWFAVLLTSLLILASFADAHHVGCGKDKGKDVILSTPQECARQCVAGKKPKICYYQFYMESYVTMGDACLYCTPNITNQLNSTCQCVTADGVERAILTVNRMIPGPSIQVCKGDSVVVDVMNGMDGKGTTIHWHGIYQNGSQYYDGVPFVTQCPIAQGNSFRYQWIAGNEGTHFWHSHYGTQRADGIFGSIVVRAPNNPNRNCYTQDRPMDRIVIHDWYHISASENWPGTRASSGQDPDALLIHGLGQFTDPTTGNTTTTPLAVYEVQPGERYRFRCISAAFTHCPIELSIQGHRLNLIATDGMDIKPFLVDTIMVFGGERYDFVPICVDKYSSGPFWIRARAMEPCTNSAVQQFGILRYKGGPKYPSTPQPAHNESFVTTGVVANPLTSSCSGENDRELCVSEMRSAVPSDKQISGEPDLKLIVGIGFWLWSPAELYELNFYRRFLMVALGASLAATLGNISYLPPPSPLVSQMEDVPSGTFCNQTNPPVPDGGLKSCTHMINVRQHSVVEIILFDQSANGTLNHPMHLHGNHFHVVGMGTNPGKYPVLTDQVIRLYDKQGLIPRNFKNSPSKDTCVVMRQGYTVLRFRADNPGFWQLHCHFEFHQLAGMTLVLHVGEKRDLPPVPANFPVCSNYEPPIKPVY